MARPQQSLRDWLAAVRTAHLAPKDIPLCRQSTTPSIPSNQLKINLIPLISFLICLRSIPINFFNLISSFVDWIPFHLHSIPSINKEKFIPQLACLLCWLVACGLQPPITPNKRIQLSCSSSFNLLFVNSFRFFKNWKRSEVLPPLPARLSFWLVAVRLCRH